MSDLPQESEEWGHPEGAQNENNGEPERGGRQDDKEGSERWIAVQSNIKSTLEEIKRERTEAQRTKNKKLALEIATVALLLVTVVLTALTYRVFYLQLKASERAIVTAHNDADYAVRNAHSDAASALTASNEAASTALVEQRRESANALQRADTANTNAVTTARRQARLTQDSNAINKQAFTAVQRAFITADQIRVDKFVDSKTNQTVGYLLTPVIVNSGQTPAVISAILQVGPTTQWLLRSAVVAYDPRSEARIPDDPDAVIDLLSKGRFPTGLVTYNIYLGPHANVPQADGFGAESISVKDVDKVQLGEMSPYFYGAIRYTDVFKAIHITKYCFSLNNLYINGLGQRTPPAPTRCAHWNCVDDQCKTDKSAYLAELAAAKHQEPEKILPPRVH